MAASANPGSAGPADSTGLHNMPATQNPSGIASSTGAPTTPEALTVIWASAAPVRLAVLKLRSKEIAPSEQEIQNAIKPRERYTIAVAGLPAPESGDDPKALAKDAFLIAVGGSPVVALDSSYRRIGNSDVYFFRFSKDKLALSPEKHQVDFKMRMGKIEIKRKFDLKEMQFRGELAL